MRAGRLDRTIIIERGAHTVDAAGTPSFTWTTLATLRAERIQSSTDEYLQAQGANAETVMIFRTRFVASVTTADRVLYEGDVFNIREVKELGRRRGLELRTEKDGDE